MKKPNISPLYVVTFLFALILTGIYVSKNYQRSPVICEYQDVQPPASISVSEQDFSVNINTASAEELGELPGIGETLARRIVTYRKVHGCFESPEALLNVEGIGKGKLEAILDHITTGGK